MPPTKKRMEVKYDYEFGTVETEMVNDGRHKYFSFRVTEEEKIRIEKKIEKSKLTKSDYLRKSVLDKKIIVVEGLPEYTQELQRIGNNLNQLTKAVNKGIVEDTGDKLKDIKKEFNEAWQQLRELHRGADV